jgi:phosphoribosylanthranilate isomerase
MFQVKICGVTGVEDALLAAEAGADAIGLNFYPKSPRYLTPEAARRIADAVRGRLLRVGVMVNPTADEAMALVSQVELDAVQLHGDEPAAMAADLSRSVPVLKAFRISPEELHPVLAYLDEYRRAGGVIRPVLFDAYHPGQFGGIGKTADWSAIQRYPSEPWHPPFVLAGGLTPDNVASAIQALRPIGVDTASGVEQSPGRKDPVRMARFIQEAKAAFASTGANRS